VDSRARGTGPDEIVAPDLASPAFKANPYPFYARLRAEGVQKCGTKVCRG